MSEFKTYINKILKAIQIFRYAYSGYKWQIALITGLGFIGGFTGGLGIGMLIPLFSLATEKTGLDIPHTFQHFLKQFFAFFHLEFSLTLVLLLMISLFIIKAIITLIVTYISERVASQYLKDMSEMLFKKTLTSSWPFLMNQKVGHLDRIITGDLSCAASVLKTMSEIIVRVTSLATYAFIAFKISAPIALLSLGCGGLILLFYKPFLFKLRRLSLTGSNVGKEVSHLINESLIGIKTLKVFGTESAIANKSSGYFEILRKIQIKVTVIGSFQGALFEPASLIFISLLFVYSYKIPGFDIASFAVIIYLIQKMFGFIQGVQNKVDGINSAYPRVKTMLDYQKTLDDYQEKSSGNMKFKFDDSVSLEKISFAYPNIETGVLENINLKVRKGEMIGIIGPSGAGKTTLVDLILRLLEPQTGSIKLDDIDVRNIALSDWRKNIGYVSQDVFLLNDTVENNIRFYDESITSSRVEEVAKLANIYDFIQELPEKFQTSVGERGVKLSGGQRQRISLARVLAKQPSLLVLDEATSSLDNESEALIQKAIGDLKGKVTVLVIAHRLSTVMNSDRLIVLNEGRIVEAGTPDELIKNSESYLYKSYHAVKN